MANISKDKLKEIIQKAPPGSNPEQIVKELVNRGHTIEGLDMKKQEGAQVTQTRKNVLQRAAEFIAPTATRTVGKLANGEVPTLREGVGSALEIGSFFVPAGAIAKGVIGAGRLARAGALAKLGAASGALSSAGTAIGNNEDLANVAKDTATGAAVGGAFGGLLGIGTNAVKMARTARVPERPSLIDAAGKVIQGKPKDTALSIKALQAVDTSNVKTYQDLDRVLGSQETGLAQLVDSSLARDTKLYRPKEVARITKSSMGTPVRVDYVTTALKHLEELYQKTADPVSMVNIRELSARARTKGITRKEINDVARMYNAEFGSKAFGKTGEPITSVTAQAYENIRKGIKETARDGLGGAQAKEADKLLSATINTRELVQKQVEAVNKLQNKIETRGIGEAAGHAIMKTLDIYTGGFLRGVVGGLLPRGVGYKTLNALDLEQSLAKNLEIIQKASEQTDPTKMLQILQTLPKPSQGAVLKNTTRIGASVPNFSGLRYQPEFNP